MRRHSPPFDSTVLPYGIKPFLAVRVLWNMTDCRWCFLAAALVLLGETKTQPPGWTQWAGPHRDFTSEATGLADSWPAAGPRRIWSRPLGEGYSGIAESDGVLYTMYRRGDVEFVVAADAETGKNLWETNYREPYQISYQEAGNGPYAMPLVLGDRIYTVGAAGTFQSLDRKTGKILWTRRLIQDMGGTPMQFGYSCQPLVYKDNLIMMVGGRGHAIVAFRPKDGSVAWQKQDFANSNSSPVLINLDGEDQVVAFMGSDVIGVDANTGDLRWSFPHNTPYGLAVSMPVWDPEHHLLFFSAAYDTGSYVLELHRQGAKTAVKQVWKDNHIQVHFGSIIRIGDYLYCSSGRDGPKLLTAVNIKSGKIAWRERGFARASLLYADGKLILVDEDGNLALARVSPERLEVISKVELLKSNAWTVPTLVGTRLYVRDRHDMMAFDIGKAGG